MRGVRIPARAELLVGQIVWRGLLAGSNLYRRSQARYYRRLRLVPRFLR